MPYRILAWALFLIGLSLFAAAGYELFAKGQEPDLVAEETDIELAGTMAGEETIVNVRLQNNAGHPIRLVGGDAC
jgi:hypothetical protein